MPDPLPTLAGSRIKQRKGVAKSQAKFEPEVFRDALFSHFESVSSPTDWDGYAAALDKAGNTLDYRKYSDQLFDILIAGGILAPGGAYEDEDAPRSSFSVFAAKSEKVEDVKPYVSTIEKVIRRYKFLQKPLEETTLTGLLQYIQRFDKEQRAKLATATALFIQSGLVGAQVLQVLQKDHLVKDELALTFLDDVLRSSLAEQPIESLGSTLRKGGIRDPLLFFPLQKRGQPGIATNHFKAVGLPQIADYFQKRANKDTRDAVLGRLVEMRREQVAAEQAAAAAQASEAANANAGDESLVSNGGGSAHHSVSNEEIIEFLTEQRAKYGLSMEDFVPIVFDGLVKSITWPSTDQLEPHAVRAMQSSSPILEPFVTNPKAQIVLVNKVQLWCYEEKRITRAFVPILKVLYNADVISDGAILYWHSKGARSEGKDAFLKAAAPLVKFLEEQSDDEDEE